MEAGQAEGRFWKQTPATFQAVFRGVKAARQRDHERGVAVAHATAAFTRTDKLKSLDHYLSKKPVGAQSPAEMIAVLRQLKASGAPMTIERVETA